MSDTSTVVFVIAPSFPTGVAPYWGNADVAYGLSELGGGPNADAGGLGSGGLGAAGPEFAADGRSLPNAELSAGTTLNC